MMIDKLVSWLVLNLDRQKRLYYLYLTCVQESQHENISRIITTLLIIQNFYIVFAKKYQYV